VGIVKMSGRRTALQSEGDRASALRWIEGGNQLDVVSHREEVKGI
jgi:hypothetical protein